MPRQKSEGAIRASEPVRIDQIIEEVLRESGRTFGPGYSALVFVRDGLGRLVIRMVPVPVFPKPSRQAKAKRR